MKKEYVVGVDVGGTNIKLGLVTAEGKILARNRLETDSLRQTKKKMIDAIENGVRQLLNDRQLSLDQCLGLGVGLPGPVDALSGVVKYLPNIPGWKNVALQKILEDRLNISVCIDNDVNNIALGEWHFGAGIGQQNIICMTLGTGVGGGLVLDGKLYRGEGFVAGEIGHMILSEKGAGQHFPDGYAYLEHYVGNQQLMNKASRIFRRTHILPEDIYTMAKDGNSTAIQFWQNFGRQIGNALVNVVNLLNPRLIIIGGGVSNNYRFFQPAIQAVIQEKAMTAHKKMVKIVRAKLGDDAGLLGALMLVKELSAHEG